MTIPGSNWRAEIGTKPAGAIREGFTEEVIFEVGLGALIGVC